MVKRNQVIIQTKATTINSLYDAYAAMLLGYISEIVKDQKVAEEYLIKVFGSIAKQFNDINRNETNTWCQLQQLAKSELTAFCETNTTVRQTSPNKYLDQMTDEQKNIFCSFYYNKKTTAELSTELNQPEELIKKSLKETFSIIKKSHDN